MAPRLVTALLAICTAFAPMMFAESTDCTIPLVIITDGRLTQSMFPQSATYWYGIYAQAGHSYSVEFEPPANNNFSTSSPQFTPIAVFAPTDFLQGCRGTSTVAVTPNSGYSPVIFKGANGAGRRVSFTAQSAGLHLICTSNVSGSGSYTFRAVDTSLINIRWNTMGGNDVQWILMNISDMPITGTLIVIDMNGQLVTAVQISIPIGGRVSRTTGSSDLKLGRELAGSALFNHNGPPGAMIAEAFLLTGAGSLSEKFEAVTPR